MRCARACLNHAPRVVTGGCGHRRLERGRWWDARDCATACSRGLQCRMTLLLGFAGLLASDFEERLLEKLVDIELQQMQLVAGIVLSLGLGVFVLVLTQQCIIQRAAPSPALPAHYGPSVGFRPGPPPPRHGTVFQAQSVASKWIGADDSSLQMCRGRGRDRDQDLPPERSKREPPGRHSRTRSKNVEQTGRALLDNGLMAQDFPRLGSSMPELLRSSEEREPARAEEANQPTANLSAACHGQQDQSCTPTPSKNIESCSCRPEKKLSSVEMELVNKGVPARTRSKPSSNSPNKNQLR